MAATVTVLISNYLWAVKCCSMAPAEPAAQNLYFATGGSMAGGLGFTIIFVRISNDIIANHGHQLRCLLIPQ